MTPNETRKVLMDDIEYYRSKAGYYETLKLFEAARYADNLADNLELALTTMASDEDIKIN